MKMTVIDEFTSHENHNNITLQHFLP